MASDKKNILVTGGAGFIGFHLSSRLAKEGHNITIVENFARGKMDSNLENLLSMKNVQLLRMDLTEKSEFEKLNGSFDYIYHLAAINGTKYFYEIPDKVLRASTLPLFHLLEWRQKVGRGKILFSSSSETYSGALAAFGKLPIPTPEDVPLVVNDPSNLRWSYAAGKIVGEVALHVYGKKYGIPYTIIRYHNIYGPRMGYEHVLPQFMQRIINKVDPFPIFGGDETRTFCYVDDAVDCTIRAMESEKSNAETFHIGSTGEISMMDLLKMTFKVAGWEPKEIEVKLAPEGSVKRREADITKAKKILGYQPKVNLEDGLKKMFEWYRDDFKK